ncbi:MULTISPECIES: hypothetical protein [unclassified Sphingomonas]|jgi:hypothetical protein|uniref:hypothetical protein n=1 Tax=unclassified Sphingomonas TaxID=196159 RepID=UPI0008371AAE|nr:MULTISPECIES: hypothetical protein [unclassified Sphingomonas]MCH4893374.1 hypothetical protein [Sphingomonas sp. SFZ2018-12]
MTEVVQMTAMPGDSVTLTHLPDYPGLHPAWTPERPYFERAYETQDGEVIRVRYAPAYRDPGMDVSIAIAPRDIALMVSASLVDEQGQVVKINGRGLVRPAEGTGVPPNANVELEPFLIKVARVRAEELLQFREQMVNLAVLIPPPPEPDQ